MAKKILFRTGLEADAGVLDAREPGFTSDSLRACIGDGTAAKFLTSETLISIATAAPAALAQMEHTRTSIICDTDTAAASIALDIKNGALVSESKCSVIVTGATRTRKVTVTYGVGKTVDVFIGSPVEFSWNGVAWEITVKNYDFYSIAPWSSATNYTTLGQLVSIGDMQFSCALATGNLNKNPITNPNYWYAVPTFKELMYLFCSGKTVIGECHPIHNFNAATYRQYFQLGQYSIGGVLMTFYGVHLDGTSVGSGTALETIIEAWHLKALLAPGATGSRVLVDARERVLRSMGATGGKAATLGAVQEDQFQGFQIQLSVYSAGSGGGTVAPTTVSAYNASSLYFGNASVPQSDGTNGTPRTGTETRVKGLVVGVPYCVLAVNS